MNVAHGRRKLPPLRRVVAYLNDGEWEWLVSAAAAQRCSVSAFVAQCITDSHYAEHVMLRESEEDRLIGIGAK